MVLVQRRREGIRISISIDDTKSNGTTAPVRPGDVTRAAPSALFLSGSNAALLMLLITLRLRSGRRPVRGFPALA
jgi:hypothetical protein